MVGYLSRLGVNDQILADDNNQSEAMDSCYPKRGNTPKLLLDVRQEKVKFHAMQ